MKIFVELELTVVNIDKKKLIVRSISKPRLIRWFILTHHTKNVIDNVADWCAMYARMTIEGDSRSIDIGWLYDFLLHIKSKFIVQKYRMRQ